jgi:hypothetical protein
MTLYGTVVPRRGHKHDPYEGGTRSTAFISGDFVPAALRGTTSGPKLVGVYDWVSISLVHRTGYMSHASGAYDLSLSDFCDILDISSVHLTLYCSPCAVMAQYATFCALAGVDHIYIDVCIYIWGIPVIMSIDGWLVWIQWMTST